MTREDAVEAVAQAAYEAEWEGSLADAGEIEKALARQIAVAALDALAPYVVLRDQMEQVGWLDEVGYLHAAPSAANHSQDTPVYIIREGS